MRNFIIGLVIGCFLVFPLLVYGYVKLGFLSLATTARPLPGEEWLAHTALRANIGNAKNTQDPLPLNDDNLLAGARAYRANCAVCHGLPGQPKTHAASGMFPAPPQLFENHGMVTDDPEGATFWIVSNGIRLSGMPGFSGTLPENERWPVTMLLKHANSLPAAVEALLRQPQEPPR